GVGSEAELSEQVDHGSISISISIRRAGGTRLTGRSLLTRLTGRCRLACGRALTGRIRLAAGTGRVRVITCQRRPPGAPDRAGVCTRIVRAAGQVRGERFGETAVLPEGAAAGLGVPARLGEGVLVAGSPPAATWCPVALHQSCRAQLSQCGAHCVRVHPY